MDYIIHQEWALSYQGYRWIHQRGFNFLKSLLSILIPYHQPVPFEQLEEWSPVVVTRAMKRPIQLSQPRKPLTSLSIFGVGSSMMALILEGSLSFLCQLTMKPDNLPKAAPNTLLLGLSLQLHFISPFLSSSNVIFSGQSLIIMTST